MEASAILEMVEDALYIRFFIIYVIVFAFSLCVFDVLLKVSVVTLLVFDNDSSPMTLCTASRIFLFYNGTLLRSL